MALAATAVRLQQQATRVEPLNESAYDAWDRFVTASPTGTFFHLTGWKRVIEKVLGHKSHWLIAHRDTEIAGVLPLSLVRSPLFGSCLVSSPLTTYGGVCASDAPANNHLLDEARQLAKKHAVKYVELRNRTESFPSDLPGRDLYITFTCDLTPGPEKLMASFPRDTRYMVRKTLKSDLRWTDDISTDEFYEVFAHSVHKLGTPVLPRSLFHALKSEFGDKCKIFGVKKDLKPIAAVMCFYFRGEVIPYYGGSLSEYNRESPNNFMYWSLIEQSCKEGYRRFDFGRSKKGTGSCKFKSSWSMKVTDLPYRYILEKADKVPEMSPIDKKFQLPVATWKKLPYSWTKIIGPQVIRSIPSI